MTFAEFIGRLGYPLAVFVWAVLTLAIMAGGLLGAVCKWIKDRRNREVV